MDGFHFLRIQGEKSSLWRKEQVKEPEEIQFDLVVDGCDLHDNISYEVKVPPCCSLNRTKGTKHTACPLPDKGGASFQGLAYLMRRNFAWHEPPLAVALRSFQEKSGSTKYATGFGKRWENRPAGA